MFGVNRAEDRIFKYFDYSNPTIQVEFIAITVVPMVIFVRALGVMSFLRLLLP